MNHHAIQKAARAIGDHSARHAMQQSNRQFYAKILKLKPLQAEITSQRIQLDEDDLVLSQWVRRYDYDFNLEIGDTLLVTKMPNDDWLAHDVVTHNPQLEGAESTDPDTVSFSTRNGHIVARVAVTDVDGNIIGYHPVYSGFQNDGTPV